MCQRGTLYRLTGGRGSGCTLRPTHKWNPRSHFAAQTPSLAQPHLQHFQHIQNMLQFAQCPSLCSHLFSLVNQTLDVLLQSWVDRFVLDTFVQQSLRLRVGSRTSYSAANNHGEAYHGFNQYRRIMVCQKQCQHFNAYCPLPASVSTEHTKLRKNPTSCNSKRKTALPSN